MVGSGSHHPLTIGLVQQDRNGAPLAAGQSAAPLDHAGVEVRMRDRNRAHLPARPHRFERDVVDQRDHVPEHVSLRRLRKQQALPDPKLRLDTDAEEATILSHLAAILPGELLEGQPTLPVEADVLALVLADRATLGRPGVVGCTGNANAGYGVSR
jgi:hypothetical protein